VSAARRGILLELRSISAAARKSRVLVDWRIRLHVRSAKSAYLPLYPEAHGDFLIATKMIQQGLRTVFEPEAVCIEETNRRVDNELRMRVRVITQTLNDLWQHRAMLNPFRSGFYAVQLFSHKVMRYLVPLFLLVALVTCGALAPTSFSYRLMFTLHMICYGCALAGLLLERFGLRSQLLAFPQYFVLTNVASVLALYKLARGERYRAWETDSRTRRSDSLKIPERNEAQRPFHYRQLRARRQRTSGVATAASLHESGRCNVRIACLQDKGSLRADAEALGVGEIPEYALTSFYDLNFVKQLRRFTRFLKENRIDVVHTHCFYTNVFGMTGAFLARVPARVTSKGETEGFARRRRSASSAWRFAWRTASSLTAKWCRTNWSVKVSRQKESFSITTGSISIG
jgi:hypothetical protein